MRSITAFSSLALATLASATCYYNDGSSTDGSFVPCNSSATNSACCASNKGSRSDICTSEGLCYAQDGGYTGLIYINGCTDPTGQDPACNQICRKAVGNDVQSWNLLQCEPGVYCCRDATDSRNCCSNSTAVVTNIAIGTIQATPTFASSSTSATNTASTTSTGAVGSTSCADTDSNDTSTCPPNNTAVVGGVLGGVLGTALLASLAALVCMGRRRNSDKHVGNASSVGHNTPSPQYVTPMAQQQHHEPPRSDWNQSPQTGNGGPGSYYDPKHAASPPPAFRAHEAPVTAHTLELGGNGASHEMQG